MRYRTLPEPDPSEREEATVKCGQCGYLMPDPLGLGQEKVYEMGLICESCFTDNWVSNVEASLLNSEYVTDLY